MKKRRNILITIAVLVVLKLLDSQCITTVRTNSDWEVFAYDRYAKKFMSAGRFLVVGRYYSEPLAPWSIAHYRYEGRRQESPLYFIVSDFPVQCEGNQNGLYRQDYVEAKFKLNNEIISVPVDTPKGWFFFKFPQTEGNNVFILGLNLTLRPLPYHVSTFEQVDELDDVIKSANSNEYINAMISKLEEYKTANRGMDPTESGS